MASVHKREGAQEPRCARSEGRHGAVSFYLVVAALSVASWACVGISVLAICQLAGDFVDAEAVFPRTSARPTGMVRDIWSTLTD